MIVANIHNAKTNLSRLIEQAEAGEEVIIARNGKPVARLTRMADVSAQPRRPDGLPAWMGSLKGQIWIGPDSHVVDEEIARSFEEGEIFPPDGESP